MHRWWVFLHIAGVFGFLMAHGVSAYVTLRLPRERDPARVSHLLEALGVLGRVHVELDRPAPDRRDRWPGSPGHFWGQGWIWAAIVVLVVVIAAMYAMGTTWAKRLRTISGCDGGGNRGGLPRSSSRRSSDSKRPYTIAAIGFVGLLADPLADDLQAHARVRWDGSRMFHCRPVPPWTVCAFDDQSFVRAID